MDILGVFSGLPSFTSFPQTQNNQDHSHQHEWLQPALCSSGPLALLHPHWNLNRYSHKLPELPYRHEEQVDHITQLLIASLFIVNGQLAGSPTFTKFPRRLYSTTSFSLLLFFFHKMHDCVIWQISCFFFFLFCSTDNHNTENNMFTLAKVLCNTVGPTT